MDWATFIKDNSQALFTLGGVLLGSAITFLGNLLNNKFQAQENDKERLEKRKEAKAQLAVELIKNDIKYIDNVNNLMFEILNKIRVLNSRRDTGELTTENWSAEIQKLITGEKGVLDRLSETDTIADVLTYANGEEVYLVFNQYKDLFEQYLLTISSSYSSTEEKESKYDELVIGAGKFQRVFREKMLSTRDIQ